MLAVNFIKNKKSFKRRLQITDSFSNKYFKCFVLVTRLKNKDMKILMKPSQSSKNDHPRLLNFPNEINFDKVDLTSSKNLT